MYNITCNTDDNYAQHCTAMLCSLFENNKDEEITVHVLCGNLSETNRCKSHVRFQKYPVSI